jgi:putative membrane protein
MAAGLFSRRPTPWKGLVAGFAGGLAATVAMTMFQNGWSKASEKLRSKGNKQDQSSTGNSQQPEAEDATMKAAGKVAQSVGYRLSHDQKKKAAPFVHYGFGTAMGALYGLAMENRRLRKQKLLLLGSGFGSAVFLAADELAVPTLGLSAQSSSVGSHLYGLASHLVYGLSAEGVRRLTRRLL